MTERGVSVCIVNYQGENRLTDVIDALPALGVRVEELLVVDSASTDASLSVLEARHPEARAVVLTENRGPAAARNRGYAEARCDRILFLDNDVQAHPTCGRALWEALDGDERAVVAMPRVVLAADPGVIQFEGADTHFLGLMIPRRSGVRADVATAASSRVDSMISACFLVDRDRLGSDPPFDEDFDFNYEDHDFGVRCRVRGHGLLAVPSAVCTHGEGTPDFSVREGRDDPAGRVYRLVRGRWVILAKSFALRTLVVLLPVLLAYEVVQLVWVVRRGRTREWTDALRWVVSRRSALLQKRRAVQATRGGGDEGLLRGGPIPVRTTVPRGPVERWGLGALGAVCNAYWRLARHVV